MFQSLAQQFNSGGPFMWVILGIFAIAAAVMLERAVYYFIINRGNSRKLAADVVEAVSGNDVADVRTRLQRRDTPLHNLLAAALDGYTAGLDAEGIQETVDTAAVQQLPKMTERLSYLSLFANTATLLGLLGTIAGLQVSFGSLASVDAAQKASMLASGIAQAMNTTAFGLIVAVPCMMAYTYLNNKQQQLVKNADEAVMTLLSFMKRKAA